LELRAQLDSKLLPSFTDLLGKVVLDIDDRKLGPAFSLGIDAFNSIPPEAVATFEGVVKQEFTGLKTDTCTLVPLPSKALADKVGARAAKLVAPEKVKAFDSTWGPTLRQLPKTDAAICLPPIASLDRLALAQADVGRGIGYAQSKAFFDYTGPMLKGEVRLTDEILALARAAQQLPEEASFKERKAFTDAGKKLEAASKRELNKQILSAKRFGGASPAETAALAAAKAAAQ